MSTGSIGSSFCRDMGECFRWRLQLGQRNLFKGIDKALPHWSDSGVIFSPCSTRPPSYKQYCFVAGHSIPQRLYITERAQVGHNISRSLAWPLGPSGTSTNHRMWLLPPCMVHPFCTAHLNQARTTPRKCKEFFLAIEHRCRADDLGWQTLSPQTGTNID
jgi:hypothetical protein